MPNKTAKVLIGAGAFSVAMAGLVPVALSPALKKAPSTVNVTTHSRSSAQILNAATGKLEPVTVDLTRKLTTATDSKRHYQGSSSVGVYHELLTLARVLPDGTVYTVDARGRFAGINADEATIAFDRKTGAGKPNVFGETYHSTGQTVKFPFDTKKKTYQYFDQASDRSWPLSYTRTTKLNGLEVYVFTGTVSQISLGQYGQLTGTEQLYSNNGITVYVEPVTGSIVSIETAPQTSIKMADGKVEPALLVDNLVPTKATIADRVSDAKSRKSQVQTLQRAPWVLGILGLLLLAGGAALGRRRSANVDQPVTRPDVSGALPTPRHAPAVDPAKTRR